MVYDDTFSITVNGEHRRVAKGLTVADLALELGLEPTRVAVPVHLAAAVGTPVVSLFAPTVPAVKWAPYRVPTVLLGDQEAVCRDTRVTRCPFAGHPCLSHVSPEDVVGAVHQLCPRPVAAGSPARRST